MNARGTEIGGAGPPDPPSTRTTPPATPGLGIRRGKRPRRRVLILLAALGLAVTLIAILAVVANRGPSDSRGLAVGLGVNPTETNATAPAAEVARIRTALHDMGARCRPRIETATEHRIEADVDQLIAFARHYPDARFSIDDETGSSVDLLLIAATEMRTCAPAAAARANRELPAQLRAPSTPSPSGPRK